MKTICLDPGHPSFFKNGEVNWGAVSKDGVREVEINLIIAGLLKEQLEDLGYKVVLTRNDNEKVVDNVERVKIAKDNNTDFIFRIHCDQTKDGRPEINGIRTFSPPPAAQSIYTTSLACAKVIHEEIIKQTGLNNAGGDVVDETIANVDPVLGMLVGTKEADKYKIPTVLVEMVYLSNPENALWINRPENQLIMAKSMARGIDFIFKKGIR